jgi:hypothetical protein
MKGSWIILAIGVSLFARPASAQHEAPSHDDRSSGDDRSSSGDVGHNDAGEHSSPADSSPSAGGESDHGYSNDLPSSSDVAPSSDRDVDDRHSHEAPDVGSHHRSEAPDPSEHSSPSMGREREDHHSRDAREGEAAEHFHPSTSPADGIAPPPGARPRDPDSVETPPTDAERRHPRPDSNRSSGGSPTDSSLADDLDFHAASLGGNYGYSPFDYDGRFGYAPDFFRNRSGRGGSVRLVVAPGQTGVYVDGVYAGMADDFNGTVQRLFLSPGHHEITLVLDGYRAHSVHVYVSLDHVIDVDHVMEREF